MSVKLNSTLTEFFSEIEIKYEWKKIFNINIMDYFPLLKQGITKLDTYYHVIVVYGLFHNLITIKDIYRDRITDKLLHKILNKYFDYEDAEEDDEDPFLLTAVELSSSNIDKIKDDLDEELVLSKALYYNIHSFFSFIANSCRNKLFTLLNNPVGEVTYYTYYRSKIDKPCSLVNFKEQSSSIRLLTNVLNNDTEDMITALYVDEIDFYIGYMDLYILANSLKYFKIANMLREMIIIKNLLMKQVLIMKFEDLIGPSDIPNIVFDIIIK